MFLWCPKVLFMHFVDVVCKYFGLSTKSFTYLALQEADSKQIMENLEAIAKASKKEFLFFLNENKNIILLI